MKDNELKDLLNKSVNPPKEKIWERIETELFPDAQTEQVLATNVNITQSTRKNFAWLYSLCALFTVVIIALACLLPTILNTTKPSIPLDYSGAFFIDINPSVQVLVDKDGKTTEVIPLNEDALVLLQGTDKTTFVGKSGEEVAVAIWDLAFKTGYISLDATNNAVLVTGALSNEELNDEWNQRISDYLMQNIKQKGVFCAVLQEKIDQTLQAEADRFGISISKYQHIVDAIARGVSIAESEYANISIATINDRIRVYGQKIEKFGGNKYQDYELIEESVEAQMEVYVGLISQAIDDVALILGKDLPCLEEQLDYLRDVLEELEDEDDEEDIEELFNQLDRALARIDEHHGVIINAQIATIRLAVTQVKEQFSEFYQDVEDYLQERHEQRVNEVKDRVEKHNRPDNFDDDYEDWLEDYHKNNHGGWHSHD